VDIPYQYTRYSPGTAAQLDYSKITGVRGLLQNTLYLHGDYFLADRTDGRAIGTVLRLSSVCRL